MDTKLTYRFNVPRLQFAVALEGDLGHVDGVEPLTNQQVRSLKARAQRMKAMLRVGKEGLSPKLLAELDHMLQHQELVKVKFDFFKEEKKELTPQLAEKSNSHLVTRVGNVVVLFRPKRPAPEE